MDAIMCGSDGSGKYKSVLEFLAVGQLPTASIRGSRKGGVRARNMTGGRDSTLTYKVKL